jgi:hypothetical protein
MAGRPEIWTDAEVKTQALDARTRDDLEDFVEPANLGKMQHPAHGKFHYLQARYHLRSPSKEFTAVVNCGAILPAIESCPVSRGAKRKQTSMPAEGTSVRATISFPSGMHRILEDIARQKKVSLAWVVREAAEQYIAGKWPLFKGKV